MGLGFGFGFGEARRGAPRVAARAPVHHAVREEDRAARGEGARADRLHGAVGAQQRHQRVLGALVRVGLGVKVKVRWMRVRVWGS